MNTQQFLMELVKQAGGDAITIVWVAYVLAPVVHWLGGAAIAGLLFGTIKRLVWKLNEAGQFWAAVHANGYIYASDMGPTGKVVQFLNKHYGLGGALRQEPKPQEPNRPSLFD